MLDAAVGVVNEAASDHLSAGQRRLERHQREAGPQVISHGPVSATLPALQYAYDTRGLVETVQDADALQLGLYAHAAVCPPN
jgi:hypothetical protein